MITHPNIIPVEMGLTSKFFMEFSKIKFQRLKKKAFKIQYIFSIGLKFVK
jgi:hypothetical protein